MERFYSLIGISCFFSLLVLTWKVLNSVWLKPKRLEKYLRTQGFNGNPYRPFLGDLNEVGIMFKEAESKPIGLTDDIVPRVDPFLVETIKKFGNNCFIWFGPKPSVFILDPELIKEIFVKHNIFQKLPTNWLIKLLVEGLFILNGEKWGQHRKILNPAFHLEKIKLMMPAFHLSASQMLSKWEAIVSPEKSTELDVWPYIQTLTSDAISRTAFGSSYEEGRKIFELQGEQAHHFTAVVRTINIPGWRFLPNKRNKRMKYINKVVDDSIRDIINKRLKEMKEGKSSNDDLLGLLLESNQKEIQMQGDKNLGMTIEEVIEECKLFYFAGEETTAVLLVWTLILLSRHQEWQSRAREEVLQQFGRNQPDFEGLNHLKIVTMILNETLRLYPPVIFRHRKILEDTKIGKFSLPSGVTVTIPIISLHRDTKLWGEDAKEFKPERFAEGISSATKGQAAFLPFGWGPRICIGQNFAMVEVKLALAMILQNFCFELSPLYCHAPYSMITLHPQHGAHLILHKIS